MSASVAAFRWAFVCPAAVPIDILSSELVRFCVVSCQFQLTLVSFQLKRLYSIVLLFLHNGFVRAFASVSFEGYHYRRCTPDCIDDGGGRCMHAP